MERAAEIKFSKDGQQVLFVQRDAKVRNSRIVVHRLGDTLSKEDQVLYEEPDETTWLSLEVSKCLNYFVMIKVSKAGHQVGPVHPALLRAQRCQQARLRPPHTVRRQHQGAQVHRPWSLLPLQTASTLRAQIWLR